MMADDLDELVEFIQNCFGDDLRVIRRYGPTGGDVLFMREDLPGYGPEEERALYDLLRRDTREVTDDKWFFSRGELRATIRELTQAQFVNLPVGKDAGVVVIVDRNTDVDLSEFTDDARSRLAASELLELN